MKKIFLLAAILFSIAASSQVVKVSLQASGLTCSMCSNAINKALKTVDFVDKIEANIKTSNFDITFKPNAKIDFDKLKSKVEDAGFFVSRFVAVVHFDNILLKRGELLVAGDKSFKIINTSDLQISGDKALRIVDKGFISLKEYKKNPLSTENINAAKVYHVMI